MFPFQKSHTDHNFHNFHKNTPSICQLAMFHMLYFVTSGDVDLWLKKGRG